MSNTENKIKYTTFLMILLITISSIYLLINHNDCKSPKVNDFVHKNSIITRNNLFDIIYDYQKNYYETIRYLNIKIVDSQYFTIKKNTLEHFLSLNKINEIKYIDNTMDCDNFSLELYSTIKRIEKHYNHSLLFGLIVGKETISHTSLHAINFFIGKNITLLMCVEPQSDKIDHCYKMLKTISFIMV